MSIRTFAKALCALALSATSIGALADNVTLSGQLGFNTDVVYIDFTVAAPSSVTLWTDSWQAGLNFDPTLSVFDATQHLVTTGDDVEEIASLLPGQGGYDSQISIASLPAGHYLLTLSASGNDPLGPTLADGFSLQGTTPIAIADWNQPSYDINANDQKGSFWRVHLDGVDAATVAAVPEPAEWMLMLAGLGVIATLARRRKAPAMSISRPVVRR